MAEVRVAEVLASLTLATDLGQGQPMEWELRGCLLALATADALAVDDVSRRVIYDLSLLRYIGCTSHAHEVAVQFGDEINARSRLMAIDLANKRTMLPTIVRTAGRGQSTINRIGTVAATLAAGPKSAAEGFRASCEVAGRFASDMGFGPEVLAALPYGFERYDGHGLPDGAAGDEIPLAMRVVQVAQDLEVLQRIHGTTDALDLLGSRAGSMYDPDVVRAIDAATFRALDDVDPWVAVLDAEPEPHRWRRGREIDLALEVLADYTDLKSPSRAGHSRAVAACVASATDAIGSPVDNAVHAALVHDLGTTGLPNSIWDKAGALWTSEWERVRLHPYLTERILARSDALRPLGVVAGTHHERADGSGYHRGVATQTLSLSCRLVAAADAYVAMTEPRAHRPARSASEAASELRAMVAAGTLDREAVDAVLAGAGHRIARRGAWPAGLSDREVEVLRLLVRGRTAKDVARELSITAKTVGSHVEHIYAKIGVSTRGAAALFAMRHGLVTPDS
jgi:HD-GYP domain-containing protein (c-di-GMP phosphodiesterase class II)/DNA-binding CsgD family transcriptional regulator